MMSDQPTGQMDLHGVDPLASREFEVLKRDGRTEKFNDQRILLAVESAFKAESGLEKDAKLDKETHHAAEQVSEEVVKSILARAVHGEQLEIEAIQDAVETALMSQGHHTIARRYIVYREERRKSRALRGERDQSGRPQAQLTVKTADGDELLDPTRIRRRVIRACKQAENINPEGRINSRSISDEALRNLYDGVSTDEIDKAVILAARARIEAEPDYTYVAAGLLLDVIYREVLPEAPARNPEKLAEVHRSHFVSYLHAAIRCGRLSDTLLDFDLKRISEALDMERDRKFQYIGLQTVYDRYLIHHEQRRLETPQYFWMRVAMGLASGEEEDKTGRAIEFYNMLSTFRVVSSTPTLFNSGTLHPQLSSCYLSTVMDDLEHIFKVVSDDARLSKWAGGLGNDWTNVRATGSHIKGTNGSSQGVVPFLKVANDTAVAVNQGGKRKGAMCAYLETWHLDIENFLELRKNTGDERRRTHDMNTANWIPDLFMKRVAEDGEWTLFDPSEVSDLHDLYGAAFEKRYEEYEAMARRGQIKLFKTLEATALWRKMLTMVFETGHPWITFKDPSNVRSPQSHAGVVHSSNLCTEILLNTSVDEVAVCNLASVNLAAHMTDGKLDEEKLAETVRTAMRMLDNVIDINYYPIPEAKNANLRHRPVGLGLMGFQDALYEMKMPYASLEAIDFADYCMEVISYHAILSSSKLAGERGAYSSFEDSKWDQGLLPLDTLDILEKERGGYLEMDRSSKLDWTPVRQSIKKYGMRNSNTMAIAPTATIANITGVTQSIEPTYKHLFVKSNLSGDFITTNRYLVEALKERKLWDDEMIDDLKYYDGLLDEIDRIPDDIKTLFKTSFEIEAQWIVECASRRQKWIDMGQSLNLYLREPNGRKLSDMYQYAWRKGLKTTYYLRTLAATQVEKSTTDINRRGLQPRWMKNKSASSNIQVARESEVPAEVKGQEAPTAVTPATDMSDVKACSLDNPDCEACQ